MPNAKCHAKYFLLLSLCELIYAKCYCYMRTFVCYKMINAEWNMQNDKCHLLVMCICITQLINKKKQKMFMAERLPFWISVFLRISIIFKYKALRPVRQCFCEMQIALCKMFNVICKILYAICEIQYAKCYMRNAKSKLPFSMLQAPGYSRLLETNLQCSALIKPCNHIHLLL